MAGKRIRVLITGFLTTVILAAAPGLAAAKSDDNNGSNNPHDQVTLCHATGSATNPYVEITVNANGSVSGHDNHSKDIIPPFSYNDHDTTKNYPGKNWTTTGQAIYNNGCVPVSGGQGGGGGGQVTNNNTTNTTNNVTNQSTIATTAGQGGGSAAAPQVQTLPQGGVAAGEGGAKAYQPAALLGLVGSLGSVASGVVLFRRF